MLAVLFALGATALPKYYRDMVVIGLATALPPPKPADPNSPSTAPALSPPAPNFGSPAPTPSAPPSARKPTTGRPQPGTTAHQEAVTTGKALVAAYTVDAAGKDQIAAFQKLVGIGVDGLYGPETAGAVMYFTGTALMPKTGPKRIQPYTP